MTKLECRMTKKNRSPNDKTFIDYAVQISGFAIHPSFAIFAWSFCRRSLVRANG